MYKKSSSHREYRCFVEINTVQITLWNKKHTTFGSFHDHDQLTTAKIEWSLKNPLWDSESACYRVGEMQQTKRRYNYLRRRERLSENLHSCAKKYRFAQQAVPPLYSTACEFYPDKGEKCEQSDDAHSKDHFFMAWGIGMRDECMQFNACTLLAAKRLHS